MLINMWKKNLLKKVLDLYICQCSTKYNKAIIYAFRRSAEQSPKIGRFEQIIGQFTPKIGRFLSKIGPFDIIIFPHIKKGKPSQSVYPVISSNCSCSSSHSLEIVSCFTFSISNSPCSFWTAS